MGAFCNTVHIIVDSSLMQKSDFSPKKLDLKGHIYNIEVNGSFLHGQLLIDAIEICRLNH